MERTRQLFVAGCLTKTDFELMAWSLFSLKHLMKHATCNSRRKSTCCFSRFWDRSRLAVSVRVSSNFSMARESFLYVTRVSRKSRYPDAGCRRKQQQKAYLRLVPSRVKLKREWSQEVIHDLSLRTGHSRQERIKHYNLTYIKWNTRQLNCLLLFFFTTPQWTGSLTITQSCLLSSMSHLKATLLWLSVKVAAKRLQESALVSSNLLHLSLTRCWDLR